MRRILPTITILLLLIFSDYAPSQSAELHPSASSLATALEHIDVVLNRIKEPLATVAPLLLNKESAAGQRQLLSGTQDVVHQWSAILTVSNGKESPSASDLFFIYVQLNNLGTHIALIGDEERLRGQPKNVVDAATALIRAQTELLPTIQILETAVADRIDLEEAHCSENTRSQTHKPR